MRKNVLLLLLVIVLLATVCSSQPLQVAWRGYEEGLEEARRTGKPVYLFFYREVCPYCVLADRTLFRSPQIVAILNDEFVPIRVDVEKSPNLAVRYGIIGVPTHVILRPNGEVYAVLIGLPSVEDFEHFLSKVLNELKSRQGDVEAVENVEEKGVEELVLAVSALVAAAAAGVVAAFSPCVLPMYPVLFLGVLRTKKRNLLSLAIGFILSYAVLGYIAGLIGQSLAGAREVLVRSVAILLFLLGALLILGRLESFLSSLTAAIEPFTRRVSQGSPLLLGILLSILWTPCIGPLTGAILSVSAVASSPSLGVLIAAAYATGFILTAIALGRGLVKIYSSRVKERKKRKVFKALARRGRLLQKLAGLVLLALGLMILTGGLPLGI